MLIAVPFGFGIFIALAIMPGFQDYAATLASYAGMMLALIGWTPTPLIAKLRNGEGAAIFASINATFNGVRAKLPLGNRAGAEAPATAPTADEMDVDSVLAELAAAAVEEAPAPAPTAADRPQRRRRA